MTLATTPAHDELERIARSVRTRGWSVPAVVLLQVIAPLGFLCGQMVTMLAPMVLPNGRERAQRWAELLEDREQMERLQQLLQASDVV